MRSGKSTTNPAIEAVASEQIENSIKVIPWGECVTFPDRMQFVTPVESHTGPFVIDRTQLHDGTAAWCFMMDDQE